MTTTTIKITTIMARDFDEKKNNLKTGIDINAKKTKSKQVLVNLLELEKIRTIAVC
jgi:flagellar assembly factor FliW